MPSRNAWAQDDYVVAQSVLSSGKYRTLDDACLEIGRRLGRPVAARTLHGAFSLAGLPGPGSYLRSARIGSFQPENRQPEPPDRPYASATSGFSSISGSGAEIGSEPPPTKGEFQPLVAALKRGPIGFEALCDALQLPPTRARKLIERAQAAGLQVHVENDHIGIHQDQADDRLKTMSSIAPIVGDRVKVAVISDTHAGSKYTMRDQLCDFVQAAYDEGIRDILHPGDVLDGCYRHGVFELTHTGIDDQCQDALETLPQLPGLRYHFISGNHDFTFAEKSGFSVGHHIVGYFRDRGRDDLIFYGDRSAFLDVHGAIVHLWHPKVGTAYARSYSIQKQIERYSSIKPQILLIGHWHVYCHIYERGIQGVACPTFQGGGSAFGKSLGGAPAIGGLILEWRRTEHGTIREFTIRTRFYFEKEWPVKIHNDVDAEPVQPTLYRSAAVR